MAGAALNLARSRSRVIFSSLLVPQLHQPQQKAGRAAALERNFSFRPLLLGRAPSMAASLELPINCNLLASNHVLKEFRVCRRNELHSRATSSRSSLPPTNALAPSASLSTHEASANDTASVLPTDALPFSSGYLPICPSCQSGLFHCFYEARASPRPLSETPILLWLNGGPGCSSMIGNFYELGPYIVQGVDGSLKKNDYSWNSRYGAIFIDNPIGTGFSRAASEDEIPQDQEACAAHLLHGLLAFFQLHPDLQGRPLFLTGESYAGKYVPALACRVLEEIGAGRDLPFSFRGIAVGNGFTDPRTQVQVHSEVMQSFGMLDEQQAAHVDKLAQEVVALVDRQAWVEAHHKRTSLCEWIEQTAGIPTLLDIRRHAKYHATEDGVEYLALFLNQPQVKAALKAEPSIKWVSCRPSLRLHMAVDTMKSCKHMVETVLESGTPTLLFQGMYDAKDGPLSSARWMKTMHNWTGLQGFLTSARSVWRNSGGRLAGYTREWENLKHVVVIGAGHQIPADQPENALEMIETWVESQLSKPATVEPTFMGSSL